MKQGFARLMKRAAGMGMVMVAITVVGCHDDDDAPVTPEPKVIDIKYLSVEVTSPIETKNITVLTFNGDDLKTYTYVPHLTGTRRISCSTSTFLDADDALVTQDANSVTVGTDADVIFDVVDLNDNIVRFTPVTTGANTRLIHNAGATLTGDALTGYLKEVTSQVNRMPNFVFEIYE
jgi:hypothetical protein